jgi:hypothetical protein
VFPASGHALLAGARAPDALALVTLARVGGASPHVEVAATALAALLPPGAPGAPTLSTSDGAHSLLLPRGADARVRLAAGPASGRTLLAQTHSLPASAAVPELEVAVLGAHARVAALPAPEPTL